MYTHGGLAEAPSCRGISSKTARPRAASQPVFMSYKLLEIERLLLGQFGLKRSAFSPRTRFTFPADRRQEKRSSSGCEHGEIQRSLDPERHRHGDGERQEEQAARKRHPLQLPPNEQAQGHQELAQGRCPGEGGDGRLWGKPIEFRDVRNKRLPSPPGDVWRSGRPPHAKAVCDCGEEASCQSEAKKPLRGIHNLCSVHSRSPAEAVSPLMHMSWCPEKPIWTGF